MIETIKDSLDFWKYTSVVDSGYYNDVCYLIIWLMTFTGWYLFVIFEILNTKSPKLHKNKSLLKECLLYIILVLLTAGFIISIIIFSLIILYILLFKLK